MLKSTFNDDDVKILLSAINKKLVLEGNNLDNKNQQSHYCDFIPREYPLSNEYLRMFDRILDSTKKQMAIYIGILARKILSEYENPVIVSLLRAGTIIGILLKRYIKVIFNEDVQHYSIGMSRGKGIDFCALNYIKKTNSTSTIIFVDGWIGKGTTKNELAKSLKTFNYLYNENVKPIIAVINDIKKCSDFCVTNEDILIPTSLVNSQGCGLISRITQNDNLIPKNSYNGAIVFDELKNQDKTYQIIDSISYYFGKCEIDILNHNYLNNCEDLDVDFLVKKYDIKNVNGLKVGINETIRIILKKKIDFVVVRDKRDPLLEPILYLCLSNNFDVLEDTDLKCRAIGVIRNSKGDE